MKRAVLCFLALFYASLAFSEQIWIDVRTPEEYAEDHIDGDMNIPFQDIVTGVEKLYPDKSTSIHLYCRSGKRAGKAFASLVEAGYTNVIAVGGIDDARKLREIAP